MDYQKFFLSLILLPIIDAPWLYYLTRSGSQGMNMFKAIQGTSLKMRLWPAIVVYLALAYLLTLQTSALGAALSGSAVYAVYDFTNLVTFKDYDISFAIQDTIWGGVLFALVFSFEKMVHM